MSDTAAHLVDRVFPWVPVRQWVLSLPFKLRYRMAYDSALMLVLVFDRMLPFATLSSEIARGDVVAVLSYSYQIIREGLILFGLLLIGRSINGAQSRAS